MLTILLTLFWIGFTPAPAAAKVQTKLQNLNAPAIETRVLALRQLAILPAQKDAMEPLLAALRDPSPAVRLEAVKTWGKVGNAYDRLENRILRRQARTMDYNEGWTYRTEHHRDWMKRLFANLKADALDPDTSIRRATLRTLALLDWGVGIIMPPNPGCGTGAEEYMPYNARRCLEEVSDANSSLLFGLTWDKNPNVVYAVVSQYRHKSDYARMQPIFRRFLTDKRPEWRAIGADGLSWSGCSADFFKRIMPLLGDPDARLRDTALYYFKFMLRGIEESDQREVNRLLVEEYADGSPTMRCSILLAHTEASWQVCPATLYDSDGDARALAIQNPTSPLPLPYLLAQLEHPHPSVRAAASEALWNRKDAQTLDFLLPLLNDPDAEVSEAQIWSASEYNDARITQPLLQALRRSQDKEGWLFRKVGSHLIQLGKPAIPLVRQLLHDDSPHVRLAALEAAAELMPEEASVLCLDALKDKSPSVRAKAAQLFKAPADETVESALISLLHDKDAQVRLASVTTLSEIGGAEALVHLSSLPEDEDDEVDEAILHAIQHLKKPE